MGTADKLPNTKLTHFDQGAGVFDVVESIEKLTGQSISSVQTPPQPPSNQA